MIVSKNNQLAGMIKSACGIKLAISTMLNVLIPGEKYKANMPTSMKALPNIVNIRNFIAEYSFRPLPHIEMRKYIGINSSSQNKKNKKKSSDVKTPITAPCKASSHMKCSLVRCVIFQEAKTDTIPSSPVNRTNGALMPSTAK